MGGADAPLIAVLYTGIKTITNVTELNVSDRRNSKAQGMGEPGIFRRSCKAVDHTDL